MSPNSKRLTLGCAPFFFHSSFWFSSKKERLRVKTTQLWRGVKIPKSLSAKCLDVDSMSRLENGQSFLSSMRSHILVDSGIRVCYKLCSLLMPSPIIRENTLHGPHPTSPLN